MRTMEHPAAPQQRAAADLRARIGAALDSGDHAVAVRLLDRLAGSNRADRRAAMPDHDLPPDHPAAVLERHAAEVAERHPADAVAVAAARAADPLGTTQAHRGGWTKHHAREVALTLAAERLRDQPAAVALTLALLAALGTTPRLLALAAALDAWRSWATDHGPPATPQHVAHWRRLLLTRALRTAAPPLPTIRWGAGLATVATAA